MISAGSLVRAQSGPYSLANSGPETTSYLSKNTHHFQCLVSRGARKGRDVEPDNSNQTISAFRNEGPANAGVREGSLTSAYRVENTTLVRNGVDMLRFRYGAESEV